MSSVFGIVGGVLGPIATVDPEDAIVTPSNLLDGGNYDFAIADMGFRVFSTDQYPYMRETAEYRKDQADVAPTVGEQSLTGWWLRAQMSFHRGAGIKFYEVLDGETVLNRYQKGVGVYPWEPGEVSLVDGFADGVGSNVTDIVPGTLSGDRGVFCVENGALVHRTVGGSTNMTSGGTVTSITTSGTTLYATVGNTIKVQDGTTTLATLWTHEEATWLGVWWAKGRLFAVDSDHNWYALPATGGTIGESEDIDPFWSPGDLGGDWVLTETPAYVLLGNGSDIFAVTIQNDGAVPTLQAPVVVGQVPIGETISCLHYYLGYIMIATQAGLRVGQAGLSNDRPVLAFGPLLIEGDFSASKRMASYGSFTYAVGDVEDYSDATLFAVNLSEEINDLQHAWTAHAALAEGVSVSQGATFDADGLLWAFADGEVLVQDSSASTIGTLETGQLRFGTLEPKLVRSIKVRVEGDGGTVSVTSVRPDGTRRFLHTMDLAEFDSGEVKEAEITLSANDPMESIGFEFTLAPSTGNPNLRPRLIGYQVRALPNPKRQRLIRVPLLIQDTERLRLGIVRGHEGSAWERLQRLEELEADQLLTQFRDFRTGESGIAVIDSVRFEGKTPSKGSGGNFGGVAYVELRKVG